VRRTAGALFFLLLRIRLPFPRASLRAAHRLRSIIDYDLIVVLGAGKLLEMGTPKELIERGQGGELWRAVEASADRAELREMAGVVDA
jgi:ABC-type multidrug transport system fused ATPase/permease subunit